MVFSGKITESAAATKTFGSLRIDRRVLSTPTRTIPIENISTVSTGTHVVPKPRWLYWLLVALFCVLAFGSMRTDLSIGPLAPNGATVVLGFFAVVFAFLALRADDKTHYLLISSNDGVLSRFTAPDRSVLEEVRSILTDKINRNDESVTCNVDFHKGEIEDLAASAGTPARTSNVAAHGQQYANGSTAGVTQISSARARPSASETSAAPSRPQRVQSSLSSALNGVAAAQPAAAVETFVDYTGVLPAIVEMHRFYARQTGTQHLEQRLSEMELLMRAGTPTGPQKSRLRELSGEMSQILGAYPQAVELFDHIGGLA